MEHDQLKPQNRSGSLRVILAVSTMGQHFGSIPIDGHRRIDAVGPVRATNRRCRSAGRAEVRPLSDGRTVYRPLTESLLAFLGVQGKTLFDPDFDIDDSGLPREKVLLPK